MSRTLPKPIKAYKHVDPAYASLFQSGQSIKIGTLEHYRAMEGERGDTMEGKVTNELPLFMQGVNDEVGKDLEKLGAISGLDTATGAKITNCTFHTYARPGFVFCASNEPDRRLFDDGQIVFEIQDLVLYANRIRKAVPLSLQAPTIGKVSYTSRQGNLTNRDTAWPDAFAKDEAFRWENELRVFWPIQPSVIPSPDHAIYVHCPAASSIIRIWKPTKA